jgi:hypothetical protein
VSNKFGPTKTVLGVAPTQERPYLGWKLLKHFVCTLATLLTLTFAYKISISLVLGGLGNTHTL